MPKVFSGRTLGVFEDASASIPLRQIDRAFEAVGIRLGQDPGGPDGARRAQFRRYIVSVDQHDPQQLDRLGDALGTLIEEVAVSKQDFLVKAAERDGFLFAGGVFRAARTTFPGTSEVSATIAAMPRSGIREIMDAAWQTNDAIVLAVGDPNFPTPRHVVDAADAAARAGKTGYVSNAGIGDLREALAEKIRSRNGYAVSPDDVVVTNGGVEGIFAALAAVLDPGDGILLPDPGWPNFAMDATMLRARILPYPLVAANGFLPDVADLERLCDAGTKAVLLNSPSNPLGAVIDRARMREIAAFAASRNLWIVSDECYDGTLFDDRFVSAAAAGDPERTISIYTFSKTYAMTGWRVGYVAAPPRATAQIAKLQEPLISCVNVPAQYAALAALTGPQDVVAEMVAAYRERRDEVCRRLAAARVAALPPSGAFYVWADVRASGMTSRDFAFALLRERGVAVAPGTAFGPNGEGFVRISLATEPTALYEGVDRLIGALAAANCG